MSQDVTAGYIVMDVERLRLPMQRITDHMLKLMGVKLGEVNTFATEWCGENKFDLKDKEEA